MKTKLMRLIAVLLLAATIITISGCAGMQTEAPDTTPGISAGGDESTSTPDETSTPDSTGDSTTSTEDPSTSTPDGTEPGTSTPGTSTEPPETSTPAPGTSTEAPETSTPAECNHSYGTWSVQKDATCTDDGLKTRTCSKCGNAQQEVIKATGHSYGSWKTTKNATCDTNGTKTRTCSKCNKTETETIAATGHTWDSGKVTTTPTSCSDMGIKTYTCTKCGKTKTEQIKGNHTFGEWKYEEYTYVNENGSTKVSHRKARTCTKCGYKETGNTPDHYCAKGSVNHTVTTVKTGTCSTPAKMRSTCKICGWYVEYDGKKGSHTWSEREVHLSDYGQYTNELDATISECSACGTKSVIYHKGEGWNDYNRYRVNLSISQGNAYAGNIANSDFSLVNHPTWQLVKRDFVYDSEGYVKQFTVYWWYNGQRYSQVIKCGPGEIEAWFAEFGLSGGANTSYQLIIKGTYITVYKTSYTG